MKNSSIALFLAMLFMLNACSPARMLYNQEAEDQCENEKFSAWSEKNKTQNMQFGEKVYDYDFNRVFTSSITALAGLNLAVRNMERMSGYILAEGKDPRPESEQWSTARDLAAALNTCVGLGGQPWVPRIGAGTNSYTFTIIKMNPSKTKVKLRIATTHIEGDHQIKHYWTYPPSFEQEYQLVWRTLEKQLFMDKHLDE